MKKPASLREYLSQQIPGLMADPDKFIIYVANGNWRAKRGNNLSYTLMYDLEIVILDFAFDEAVVFAYLMAWLQVNQHELISNPDKLADGMRFEVDYLTHETVDIQITLKLTEDVLVTNKNGQLETIYKPEPDNQWIHDRIQALGLKTA